MIRNMKKIRINNDIDIVVKLKNEAGAIFQPRTLENIAVVLSTGLKKHKVENFTLLSDGVGFRFTASEQARTGVYDISVTAVTADGRTFTTDVCRAFELVACSCNAGGEAGEVEVENVNVAATFAISAFDERSDEPLFDISSIKTPFKMKPYKDRLYSISQSYAVSMYMNVRHLEDGSALYSLQINNEDMYRILEDNYYFIENFKVFTGHVTDGWTSYPRLINSEILRDESPGSNTIDFFFSVEGDEPNEESRRSVFFTITNMA